MKTFWGWREKQLADGTLILTSPSGDTHVTTPGSALLFPSLCGAVGGMPAPEAAPPPADYCGDRAAMMPKRRRTRTQDRAHRVATERRHNRAARRHCTPATLGHTRHQIPTTIPRRFRREPLLRCDGEQAPLAGHALERVSAAVLELES
jgi:hypothetical protein